MKKELTYQGLCFRCEHRALSLEKKGQPRCECGMHNTQVGGCYMYQPCKPVVTIVPNDTGKRPRFAGWMLSARERGVKLFEGKAAAIQLTDIEAVILWYKEGDIKRLKARIKRQLKQKRRKNGRR